MFQSMLLLGRTSPTNGARFFTHHTYHTSMRNRIGRSLISSFVHSSNCGFISNLNVNVQSGRYQSRTLSTAVASLQNDNDTIDDDDDDDDNYDGRKGATPPSRLSSIYSEMFEGDKDIRFDHQRHDSSGMPNKNNQKKTFYDEEEEEHEMLFNTANSDNQDYIDYIASFENQNPQHSSSIDMNKSGHKGNNNMSSGKDDLLFNANKDTSAMMDDLFNDDYPAALPMSGQELQETSDMVKDNHDRYTAQYQSRIDTTKTAAPTKQMKKNHQQEQHKQENKQFIPPQTMSQTPKATQPKISSLASSEASNTSRLSPPPQKVTTSEKEILQFTIHQIQSQIYKLNNNTKFNINSYKQVSKVLFGVETESTNREVLEGLTGNIVQHLDSEKNISELAKLILEFRKLHSRLKKMEREEVNKANGSHVNHYTENAFGVVSANAGGNGSGSGNVQMERTSSSNGNKPTSSSPSNGKNGTKDKSLPTELTLGHKHHQNGETAIEPLVLIDASAYIFRAYYSMPPIHRPDGEPTGATLGFCNMLNRLVLTPSYLGQNQNDDSDGTSNQVLPPRVVLIFDSKDGTNFRKELYPEYKANRKPCPIDLIPQFDFVRDAADAYGILQLEAAGYEADDVIATIATKALEEGCFVNILSGDKDLMQLVTKDKIIEPRIDDSEGSENGNSRIEPCIQLIDPMNMVRVDYNGVIDKWGVEPERLGDVLALAGDTADNIPGVPGIGPKIAVSLIEQFGSLEGILENVDSIKQKARREKLKDNADMVSVCLFVFNQFLNTYHHDKL